MSGQKLAAVVKSKRASRAQPARAVDSRRLVAYFPSEDMLKEFLRDADAENQTGSGFVVYLYRKWKQQKLAA